jgi:hypothetical protein
MSTLVVLFFFEKINSKRETFFLGKQSYNQAVYFIAENIKSLCAFEQATYPKQKGTFLTFAGH